MSVNINNTENMTAQEFYDTIMELQGEVENLRAQAKAKKEKGKGKSDISKEIGSIMSQIREWMDLFEKYHRKEYYQALREDGKGLKTYNELINDELEAERKNVDKLERWIGEIDLELLKAGERRSKLVNKRNESMARIEELESGGDIWK